MLIRRQLASLMTATLLVLTGCNNDRTDPLLDNAREIVDKMTLEQKIAQKMMLSFRYWCDGSPAPDCTDPMLTINQTIQEIIARDQIGGVILFANNLQDVPQLAALTWQLQQAVAKENPLGLFIGIDQEGGNVVRLPRHQATNFPGNMALAAATQNPAKRAEWAYQQGQIIASEIGSVGFNVNFAPVVDVQSNPLNPVINVRAFGDDPARISELAGQLAQGMASRNVLATFKHFPGHGDTRTDSHFGLPIVNRTQAEAFEIDIAPYEQAIREGLAPDMVMSAHIQYPALDDSVVTSSKTGETMLTPATLSRRIINDLLRSRLGYDGLIITDALDMKGIADFFTEQDAVIKAFQAGVDIALMPTDIRTGAQRHKLDDLIRAVATAVHRGEISEHELTLSVARIVKTKLKRNLFNHHDKESLEDTESQAMATLGKESHKRVEREITLGAITLLKNEQLSGTPLLPMRAPTFGQTYVLTPWPEQYAGMERALTAEGIKVTGGTLSERDWATIKREIAMSDTLIMATLSTGVSPVDKDGVSMGIRAAKEMAMPFTPAALNGSLVFNTAEEPTLSARRATARLTVNEEAQLTYDALAYARSLGKRTIVVSMRAPYDLVNYMDVADAALASYNYYGFNGDWNSETIPAITKLLVGTANPRGKLPINIYQFDEQGEITKIRYPRGFGLSY